MKKISNYFKELKEKKDFSSDYKVSQFLGVSKQYGYRIRDTGKLSDKICLIIAIELDIKPIEIISAREYENAIDEEVKKYWLIIHNESKSEVTHI